MENNIFLEKLDNSEIVLGTDEKVKIIAFLTAGWVGKKKLTFKFGGEGSDVEFLAIVLGTGKERFEFETAALMEKPHNKAHFTVKCAMFDESYVDYVGRLNIEKGAFDSDVYLAHHTLLLGSKSVAKTLPALEIEADEVKAGHAASLGKVDEEMLFYFETRGFNKSEAEMMIVRGFLEDVVLKVEDEALKERLITEISEKLPYSIT